MQKGTILHNSVLPCPAALRQHCHLTSDDFTDEAKSLLTPGLNTQLTFSLFFAFCTMRKFKQLSQDFFVCP